MMDFRVFCLAGAGAGRGGWAASHASHALWLIFATMESNTSASSSHYRQGQGGAPKDAPNTTAGAPIPAAEKTSTLSADVAARTPLPETPCPSPPEKGSAVGQGGDGGVAVLSAAAAAAWAASGQVAKPLDGKQEGADANAAAAANGGTSKSGGRLARAPLTISPAPFRRSESAKAMAEAAAVVTSSTLSASAASTQASITGKVVKTPGRSSSADTGGASDDNNGVSITVNTNTQQASQGATSTTVDMQTPTRSPIHRRPVLTSAVATGATSQSKSGMEGDRQHPPLPCPPPMTSASPLRGSLASSQNSIADDKSQTKDQPTDGEKKDDAKPAPDIELDPDPPILQSLRQMPLNKMLSKPRRPSKCPLFCAFYSEFDNVVGPKLCFQSPANFMQSPITADIFNIHHLLAKEFELIFPDAKEEKKKTSDDSTKTVDGVAEEATKIPSPSLPQEGIDESIGNNTEKVAKNNDAKSNGGGLPNLHMPDIEDDGDASKQGIQTSESTAAAAKKMESTASVPRNEEIKPGGRPPIPLKRPNRLNNVTPQSQAAQNVENIGGFAIDTGDTSDGSPGSFSIFDSTSEYIITGNDIADQMICLSTHNMHILTRPTIIKDTRYERNSLLFSVGFVIRRLVDPRPYRLILSKLAQTLRIMEVESRFLTSKETRPELRRILQSILVSLNSRRSECNLLLDSANVLNLKLFRPPREPAPPVPDHAVPILLRPEAQMQLFDWDLTINWIVPHIDGFKHAKLISQSSEVDMEMVRACLRVLRHHGVLALVDVFRYANIYESTPLAASVLAGEQTKLLEEAYAFASKSTNIPPVPPMKSDASSGGSRPGSRAATPSFLEHYQGNPLSPRSLGDNPNTPSGRDITLSPAALGFDPSTLIRPLSGASLVPPTGQSLATSFPPRAANRADAPIGANSSSQPTRDGATPSSAQQHMAASHASSRLSMSASEAAQEATVLPSKKKERKMKTALALLYNSCTRSKSFGELLIEKVVARPPSRDVDRPRGATTPTRRMRERGSSSALDSDGNDSGHNSAQEGGSLSSTPREEFGVSSPGRAGRPNRTSSVVDDLDWSDVFDHFDHRRLVTFGVVHGLIRRVHIFPMAYESGGDDDDETSQRSSGDESPSGSFVDDLSDGPIRTRTEQQSHTVGGGYHFQRNARGKNYTSPTLQPVPFSAAAPSPLATALKSTMAPMLAMAPLSLGISAAMGDPDVVSGPKAIKARQAKERLKRLSYEIAETMDGSKCDDELACMYEKPFDELLDLVKKIGKEVVTIKSIATDN